jgi:hypothetical protein
MLIERNYPVRMVDSAMNRARAIKRSDALRPAACKPPTPRRPVWVTLWDPRLPSLQAINQKHWRTMTTTDPYLNEVFPQPPLIAYKRQKNIRDFFVRAKIPSENTRSKRTVPGMKKCPKNCLACPYVKERKEIQTTNFKWKINQPMNCQNSNVVYMIECSIDRCKMRYIGETERSMKDRLMEHLGHIRRKETNQPIGNHFNLPGHSQDNVTISILERVKVNNILYRQEREKYLIKKFNTFYSGMNKSPGIL